MRAPQGAPFIANHAPPLDRLKWLRAAVVWRKFLCDPFVTKLSVAVPSP